VRRWHVSGLLLKSYVMMSYQQSQTPRSSTTTSSRNREERDGFATGSNRRPSPFPPSSSPNGWRSQMPRLQRNFYSSSACSTPHEISSVLSDFFAHLPRPPNPPKHTDTGDRPYKCQHCGDQFARSDLLSRHVNKCHSSERPASAPNNRRKGSTSATRATTSKQACDQCVITNLPCDGSNPCCKSPSIPVVETKQTNNILVSSQMYLSQVSLYFYKIPPPNRPHRARSSCPFSPER